MVKSLLRTTKVVVFAPKLSNRKVRAYKNVNTAGSFLSRCCERGKFRASQTNVTRLFLDLHPQTPPTQNTHLVVSHVAKDDGLARKAKQLEALAPDAVDEDDSEDVAYMVWGGTYAHLFSHTRRRRA